MELSYKKIVNTLSENRFQSYMDRCGHDIETALRYYDANVALSQACYQALHTFEISLRNRMHFALTEHFGTDEWYNQMLSSDQFADFHQKIMDTKGLLQNRGQHKHSDKMVAEFSLGFWVKMFNKPYQMFLWKPLRKIFVNLPRKNRKRGTVSKALNHAKTFRNRIFHFEPICWRFSAAKSNYDNIMKIIRWLDGDFHQWTNKRCTFDQVMQNERKALEEKGVNPL